MTPKDASQTDTQTTRADHTPRLSIVIVNYNCADDTEAAVQSVLNTMGDLKVEIIVVDNASSDDSVTRLRGKFPQITVADTQCNGGYAWGNNVGIRLARGEYVLVLNPDALVHENTLTDALSYMEAHPEIGLLGARVITEDGPPQLTVFRLPSLRSLFWNILIPNSIIRKSRFFGDQRYASRSLDTPQDVEVIAGCFMLISRALIDQIGEMDSRFFMYSEETEWCWRVQHAGRRVHYNPDLTITHHGAVTTGKASPWKAVEIAKGHILFFRFTRGPVAAWIATAIMVFGDVLRGLALVPLAFLGRAKDHWPIWRARFGFLLGALIRPPQGQDIPLPEALDDIIR